METVTIMGASRGIGLALVKHYLSKGYKVNALVRKTNTALIPYADQVNILEGFDLLSEESFNLLAEHAANLNTDIYIHNAGIFHRDNFSELNTEHLRESFFVNSIAPLMCAAKMAPSMRKGSKIAMISSNMGSISDNDSGSTYSYRMSKAALNAATRSLAIDLKSSGIHVVSLHPGFVKTDMTGGSGFISPIESAAGIFSVMEKVDENLSGKFLHAIKHIELTW